LSFPGIEQKLPEATPTAEAWRDSGPGVHDLLHGGKMPHLIVSRLAKNFCQEGNSIGIVSFGNTSLHVADGKTFIPEKAGTSIKVIHVRSHGLWHGSPSFNSKHKNSSKKDHSQT